MCIRDSTYAKVSYLEKIFTEAISCPEVKILSIATRPDCLDDEILTLLARLNRIKPVWVELGLQTIHEPVSYTHLDVYKRQVYHHRRNFLFLL